MQLWLKLQFCWISTQGPLRQCSMCWPSRTNNHVHERLAWRETLTQKCNGAHRHLLPHDNWLNDPIAKPASAFMSPSCESIHRHIPTSIIVKFQCCHEERTSRASANVGHSWAHPGACRAVVSNNSKAMPQRSTEIVLLKLGLQQQTKRKWIQNIRWRQIVDAAGLILLQACLVYRCRSSISGAVFASLSMLAISCSPRLKALSTSEYHKSFAVVPHKAVAEVSKIGNYRRGELLWCMDGRANSLMDRKVVVIFGVVAVCWSGHLTHNCRM